MSSSESHDRSRSCLSFHDRSLSLIESDDERVVVQLAKNFFVTGHSETAPRVTQNISEIDI